MSIAHSCFSALMDLVYGPQQRWRGFRTPPLIRIVKGESGLLAYTNGGPRVFINLEDLLSRQAFGAPNEDFQARHSGPSVVSAAILRSSHASVLHAY